MLAANFQRERYVVALLWRRRLLYKVNARQKQYSHQSTTYTARRLESLGVQ